MAFLEPMLQASKSDWKIDGLERALELEQIEESMFFNQIKLHRMDHSFKILIEELYLMWDEYGIPYNKGKRLLLVEIEMVSLLMCYVPPYNYSEQGIWVNDKSQGQYYNFFGNKDVIHPLAVQLLLNNGKMLQKYMFITEKALKRRF